MRAARTCRSCPSTTSTCSTAATTTTAIVGAEHADFAIARAVTRAMVPTAGDYVIPTFFRPPARARPHHAGAADPAPRGGRRRARAAASTCSSTPAAAPRCSTRCATSGLPCRVYGMRDGPEAGTTDGAIDVPPALRRRLPRGPAHRARGDHGRRVLAAERGGVPAASPCSSVPLHGQFEQLMNARYLEREGYGLCAPTPGRRELAAFLRGLPRFADAARGLRPGGQRVGAGDDRGDGDGGRRGRPPRAAGGPSGGAEGGRMIRPAIAGAGGRCGAGVALLRRAVPDGPALRPHAVPGPAARGTARAHLRRRPQPGVHAARCSSCSTPTTPRRRSS